MNDRASNLLGFELAAESTVNLLKLVDREYHEEVYRLMGKVAIDGAEQTCTVKIKGSPETGSEQTCTLQMSRYVASDIQLSDPLVLIVLSNVETDAICKVDVGIGDDNQNDMLNGMTKLLSATSHEMRTPLNAIIGFSEMLEGKAGQTLSREKQVEYAALVEKSARQMLEMTGDLLDLSKLRSGAFELHLESIDVDKVCRGNRELAQPDVS